MAAAGVMDHDVMQRLLHLFSSQYGQQAYAVLSGIGGQLGVENATAGGHDIGESDGLGAARAGLHLPWPAHDERHAMSALVGIRLPAAPVDVEMHARRVELREVRLGRGAVVAGENDHRIAGLVGVIQCLQKFADGPVGFHKKIRVGADAGDALELATRRNGRVWRGHGEIQKERLLFAFAATHVFCASLAILEQDGGEIPVRDSGPSIDADHRALFHLCGEIAEKVHIFAPNVGRPVRHIIAEVVVKAVTVWSTHDRFGEINFIELFRDAAVFSWPIPAQMPFTNHARGVALRTEHFRQRKAGIGDERTLPFPHDAALETAAPIVPSRQQSVTRWRAYAGC